MCISCTDDQACKDCCVCQLLPTQVVLRAPSRLVLCAPCLPMQAAYVLLVCCFLPPVWHLEDLSLLVPSIEACHATVAPPQCKPRGPCHAMMARAQEYCSPAGVPCHPHREWVTAWHSTCHAILTLLCNDTLYLQGVGLSFCTTRCCLCHSVGTLDCC